MTVIVADQTSCLLGEGPMWHPIREELFWFDIVAHCLYAQQSGKTRHFMFDEPVSAAGWLDRDSLLVASASSLLRFDIASGYTEVVIEIEADNQITRSNDGRADPWGGFWIGTMGRNAEPDAGAIYRYYRGELRQLHALLTIPNAICFSPDRRYAYFTDTTKRVIWRQLLTEQDGWPNGPPETFIDLVGTGLNPDGAVCDQAGYFWNAQWGAARLARYTPDGVFDQEIKLPTDQITCPAFGGADLRTLFATSARQGLGAEHLKIQEHAGKLFAFHGNIIGQKEHRVVL